MRASYGDYFSDLWSNKLSIEHFQEARLYVQMIDHNREPRNASYIE